MTAELMHYTNGMDGHVTHDRIKRPKLTKIIHVTCINLVGITCENRRTTTDFRIYDLHHRMSGENTSER